MYSKGSVVFIFWDFIFVCDTWYIPRGVAFVSDALRVGWDCDVTCIHLVHCSNLLSVFSDSF